MKLSPDSTFPLIILMTWSLELLDFITARPTDIPQGKKDLKMLYQDMRMLMKLVSQERHGNRLNDFEQLLLTSLPSSDYSTKDLDEVKVSSTLAQLYSGLKSFKFHLDWIQQKKEEMGSDSSKTKKLAHFIQDISHKVLRQIEKPPEIIYPSLPRLKSFWDLHQANAEIYDKLYYFCNWYIRALGVLKQ